MVHNRYNLIANTKTIENDIKILLKDLLNNHKSNFLSGITIREIIEHNYFELFGKYCEKYDKSISRRAMADLAFTDKDGFYYVVDVKTHRLDTKFNMPNLTSVERLSRFYEEDVNYFTLLKIDYRTNGTRVEIAKITFAPIEFFDWDCLTIGALGWGQIQIANANVVKIAPKNSRKKWMLELCDTMLEFYPKEIGKIGERIDHFKKIRKVWEKKKE